MKSSKYSCNTRSETLKWVTAIIDFLKPYSFLINAHLVNFFKDKQWEAVDQEWMSCLKDEKPENILLIPSGGIQDHWPASLKEFVHALRSLSFPREQADLQAILTDVDMASLSTVLSQGMNLKKKHEVEVLSAVVSSVVNSIGGAPTVVDVGAGQGYLAQVLSFQYKHSVVAIDSSSHHGKVTDARAARITKHFAAQMRKSGSGNKCPDGPMTITCRVLSTEMLKALTDFPLETNDLDIKASAVNEDPRRSQSSSDAKRSCSLVLAGLHACGDLSVTMLRTFMECKEVKAVVSVGCCYNLLSEKSSENVCSKCGFPMSIGLKSLDIVLGKRARDLACQSAERWSSLGEDAGLQNFELHSFRAAFQMVLSEHYPEVSATSPSIGRQGKAFRRQQERKALEIPATVDTTRKDIYDKKSTRQTSLKSSSFEKYCLSAFSCLNLEPPQDLDLSATWKEVDSFTELIGPYWSIRAALGPVIETLILLDRLMYLQEQSDSIKVVMLPIFDPTISPRNVAIIAKRL